VAGVNFCFWIEEHGQRSGGVVMLPNGIGDFFLIPPESDAARVLALVLPLLTVWSDAAKPIRAQAITTHVSAALQAAGFVLQESRFWMIRPTAVLATDWPPDWTLSPTTADQAGAIASLFHAAFRGGVGQYGTRDIERAILTGEIIER
jgi:hypothetical protein